MDHSDGFAAETRQTLEEYGWHSGRQVDTTQWESELVADGFPSLHPAARVFLERFGGLWFLDGGSGVTRAREPFELVPTACEGEADRFIEWSAHLGRSIAPIGELGAGTCSWSWLGIDERQEIYLVSDWLGTFGRMPRAMDGLILGYMPRELD
ncbi:SUKH-3 domain-containing protein [Actinoplanes sp. NPDC020271]|uniref:SUKH-3 domain-containing protein n=1 Tax=Actinoplanes sp. NPDC020271 TaxID=3363896 RepID=UPI0037B11570